MRTLADAWARLIGRFDEVMTVVDRNEAQRSRRLRVVNLLGIALACVVIDWSSPAATALAIAIGSTGLLYLILYLWRRRRSRRNAAVPPAP